jgi:hypothetical protein
MKRTFSLLFFAAMGGVLMPETAYAAAKSETAGHFLDLCKPVTRGLTPENSNDAAICASFVNGAMHGFVALSTITGTKLPFCFRTYTNTGGILRMWVDWMNTHPDSREIEAGGVLLVALAKTHPCR